MFNADTSSWLKNTYPGLIISKEQDEVKGKINVKASYNFETDTLLNLSTGGANKIGGEVLSGEFSLTISNRIERAWSDLPAVFVHDDKIPLVMSRHFNERLDKSACLCGPIQEKNFLSKEFDFGRFFERLVIPFLYGQLYFNKYEKWPWKEFAHGGTGALESYSINPDPSKAFDCITALKMDRTNWERIEKCLIYQEPVKGHIPCFCGSGRPIRSCHPEAWQGIIKLKEEVHKQNIQY